MSSHDTGKTNNAVQLDIYIYTEDRGMLVFAPATGKGLLSFLKHIELSSSEDAGQ